MQKLGMLYFYLKPLDLPPLKLQFIFQVTYTCLLFTNNAAPHSGWLQELHPWHTQLELQSREKRVKSLKFSESEWVQHLIRVQWQRRGFIQRAYITLFDKHFSTALMFNTGYLFLERVSLFLHLLQFSLKFSDLRNVTGGLNQTERGRRQI